MFDRPEENYREFMYEGNSRNFPGDNYGSDQRNCPPQRWVYRQDCETFGMVVKMLVNKDPTLEKQVQLSLRENLREIGERCIEEIKNFISEYDNAPAQPE
ncbi:Periphilin-1 [Acipenser ruthenus]|uniref:Periphilin-1 n=1 Tax=Acipenser ruthenus TaxID=7906 RepID=A0A444UPD7_ACIRT|nr:Periphilin-1 [Acipenser ruthenus]